MTVCGSRERATTFETTGNDYSLMTNQPLHVLVVDDEQRFRAMLRRYLGGEGYKVSDASSGDAMRTVFSREPVDLVLLDLTLGSEDGLSLARDLRQSSDVPIIMLTGKGELVDRVVGLESGADDYLTKPFELRELLARIRTVMRRASRKPTPLSSAPGAATGSGGSALAFEGWRLDLLRRELHRPTGELVSLTAGEFELLRTFLLHPNRVLRRDQLLDLVKGREWAAFDRAVDTQVVRLRRKIEPDPAVPTLIKTVRGSGYIFAAAVKSA